MTSARRKKNIYCFDTSAFLALSRTNETIIKIPLSLWRRLDEMMRRSDLISHRIVFDEIDSGTKNPQFITKWIQSRKNFFLPKTDAQIRELPGIIQEFPELIDPKAEKEQADPWLIALAMEKSKENNLFEILISVVVSQENARSPAKIPAACKHFNIKHLSLREFFDSIGISTELKNK